MPRKTAAKKVVVPSGETKAEPIVSAPDTTATVSAEVSPEVKEPEQYAYYRGDRAVITLKEVNSREYYEVKTSKETALLTKEEFDKEVTYS